ncbi:hypothetical protein KUF71_013695 [Frankliniella fusca]|uniref:Uncharacterized protein n=1 Tax=Frankliniella fusca TaxID=407009 RepID=A0AAE1LMU5_9NEOP|nr:hypothetical protein KUF71_013695 [Frankliniella fusca]
MELLAIVELINPIQLKSFSMLLMVFQYSSGIFPQPIEVSRVNAGWVLVFEQETASSRNQRNHLGVLQPYVTSYA